MDRQRQPHLAELIGPSRMATAERRAFALAAMRSHRKQESTMGAIENGFLCECTLPDPVHRRASALAERLLQMRVRHLREREDLIDELNKYRRRMDESNKENLEEVIDLDFDNKENENEEKQAEEHNIIECCFCLDELQEGETICRLPCLHVFHADCVVPYLLSKQNPTCPICRHPVQPNTVYLLPKFEWKS